MFNNEMNTKNGFGNNWIPYRHHRLHNDGKVYKRYQYNNKKTTIEKYV